MGRGPRRICACYIDWRAPQGEGAEGFRDPVTIMRLGQLDLYFIGNFVSKGPASGRNGVGDAQPRRLVEGYNAMLRIGLCG